MWVVHLTPLTPPAQYYFPPYTPKSNFKIIPFNDFLLLNGVGLFFPKILDNLEVVTISDYIEVQTQTRSKQTRNDQTRVPQTRWNAFTFLNHTFLGLTSFNFKRCGGEYGKKRLQNNTTLLKGIFNSSIRFKSPYRFFGLNLGDLKSMFWNGKSGFWTTLLAYILNNLA